MPGAVAVITSQWNKIVFRNTHFSNFQIPPVLWSVNGRNIKSVFQIDPNCGHTCSLGTGQLIHLPHPAGLKAVSDAAEGPCPTLRCRTPVVWPRPVGVSSSSGRRPAWRGSRYTWVEAQQTFSLYLFHFYHQHFHQHYHCTLRRLWVFWHQTNKMYTYFIYHTFFLLSLVFFLLFPV